ncbi:hypothetical protein OG874_30180 [Nocardia sp. NBC_00565]|uniref:hypothetical protein n=1 Tax=Nocardia sp. NBC_00565 TaxID=2975993 RepID=UPI002E815949|nr:hypothetical protein [Nocardia sp. NBC_00565]WUC01069.1 hypothetical protein OG874_30180 [Nocardia sp. NBC_00565]
MDTVALLTAANLSRARSAVCVFALVGVVTLRLSSLPTRESLVAHTAATSGIAVFSVAVALFSVVLVLRSRIARAVSVLLATLAVASCLLQVAKIYFAAVGHRDLVFQDHVLVDPRGSLAYFNIPLVVTYTADIVLWFVCLLLSMASTAVFKSRTTNPTLS